MQILMRGYSYFPGLWFAFMVLYLFEGVLVEGFCTRRRALTVCAVLAEWEHRWGLSCPLCPVQTKAVSRLRDHRSRGFAGWAIIGPVTDFLLKPWACLLTTAGCWVAELGARWVEGTAMGFVLQSTACLLLQSSPGVVSGGCPGGAVRGTCL